MQLKKKRPPAAVPSGGQTLVLPEAETRRKDGALSICLHGDWVVHTLSCGASRLAALSAAPGFSLTSSIDLENIGRLDTSGALLINKLQKELAAKGTTVSINGLDANKHALLAVAVPPPCAAFPVRPGIREILAAPLEKVGRQSVQWAQNARNILNFLGLFLITLGRVLLRPWNIRWTSLIYHMGQAGVGALPIAMLLSFLIGMVLAYMSASPLATLGAQVFVVKLLEVGVLREMAVLITAILIAGRSGSSFTAQIGSMKANEEVDTMRSMGIDPMETLVLPRVLALIIMLPILVLAADVAGMAGGLVAVWLSLDISPATFMDTLQRGMVFSHLFVGLFKAPFFAVVIGCVGCFCGFAAEGSADSVGRMTTRAVVESIFLVITLDALFALCYITLHI